MTSPLIKGLTCSICQKLYTEPTILPCMHTFCKKCLLPLVVPQPTLEPLLEADSIDSNDEDEMHKVYRINCPMCNFTASLDDNGVDCLPENKTYANILSKYSTNVKQNEPEVKCDICESEKSRKVVKYCTQCCICYCDLCLDQFHPHKGKLSKHKLCEPSVDLQNLHDDSLEEITSALDDWWEKYSVCFCIDCRTVFKYTHDTRETHKNHMFLDLKVAKAEKLAGLEVSEIQLESMRTQWNRRIEAAELSQDSIQLEGKRLISDVKKSINILHGFLDEKEHALIAKIRSEIMARTEELGKFIEKAKITISKVKKDITVIKDVTNDEMSNISMEHLLEVEDRVCSNISSPTENQINQDEFSNFKLDVKPVEDAIRNLGTVNATIQTVQMPKASQQVFNPAMFPGNPYVVQQNAPAMPFYVPIQTPSVQGRIFNNFVNMPMQPPIVQGHVQNIFGMFPQGYRLSATTLSPQKTTTENIGGTCNSQQQVQQVNKMQEAISAFVLQSMPPQERKQVIGERLFPLVQRMCPDLAGKITGMLLELRDPELLHLVESQEFLQQRVKGAIELLQAHARNDQREDKVSSDSNGDDDVK